MIFLYIDSLNSTGDYRKFCLGTSTIDLAFEFINRLVRSGCHLISLKLVSHNSGSTYLPIEAFIGQSMIGDLQTLQQQWEEILAK